MSNKPLIASPLNYTGGKFKLLPQILPLLPSDVDTFVDLFTGGCNVGINVNAERVVMNDTLTPLISMYKVISELTEEALLNGVESIIKKHDLSLTSRKGYAYYGANSSDGMASVNRSNYLKLREEYNSLSADDSMKSLYLYVLIVYGFNNQIRFNSKGGFNLPVGKRDFNDRMRDKLITFRERVSEGDYRFTNESFNNLSTSGLTSSSLVYCDPPYLISTASYNEGGGWTERDEISLLSFLKNLDSKGIRFALSNVMEHKNKKNEILETWANTEGYNVYDLNQSYDNSNYQSKDRGSLTREVLITNY